MCAVRFVSAFSGGGGFDLGFEWAGWEVACQIESDPYCNAVLETHWPEVKRLDDITTATRATVGTDTLALIGGFPRLTPTECEVLQGFPVGWTIPATWNGKIFPVALTRRDTESAATLSRLRSPSGSERE